MDTPPIQGWGEIPILSVREHRPPELASTRTGSWRTRVTVDLDLGRLRWMRPMAFLVVILALAILPATSRAEEGRAEVIVQLQPGTSLTEGGALVHSVGGRVTRYLDIINGLGAVVSADAAAKLERDPRVYAVSANAPVAQRASSLLDARRLKTSFNQSLGVTNVWRGRNGVTGR